MSALFCTLVVAVMLGLFAWGWTKGYDAGYDDAELKYLINDEADDEQDDAR